MRTVLAPGRASRGRPAGFTLVELMLVVAIIGILAAIALPAYNDYVIRGRVAEGIEFTAKPKLAVKEYYDRWGVLPADNARAGLPPASDMRGRYVDSVSVSNGVVEVVFGKSLGLPSTEKGRSLYLLPGINREVPSAPLAWQCGVNPKPDATKGSPFEFPVVPREREFNSKYRPGSCRG